MEYKEGRKLSTPGNMYPAVQISFIRMACIGHLLAAHSSLNRKLLLESE